MRYLNKVKCADLRKLRTDHDTFLGCHFSHSTMSAWLMSVKDGKDKDPNRPKPEHGLFLTNEQKEQELDDGILRNVFDVANVHRWLVLHFLFRNNGTCPCPKRQACRPAPAPIIIITETPPEEPTWQWPPAKPPPEEPPKRPPPEQPPKI
ncbi:hypothetical protein Ciccas_014507, partial [Cichlidogyrus casuarinus]